MPLGLVSSPFCTVDEPTSTLEAVVMLLSLLTASTEASVESLAATDLLGARFATLSVFDAALSSVGVPPPQAARKTAEKREARTALLLKESVCIICSEWVSSTPGEGSRRESVGTNWVRDGWVTSLSRTAVSQANRDL